MPVAVEIFRAYFEPRCSARRMLLRTDSEGKAFALVFTGCVLLFLAQLPDLVRPGASSGTQPSLTALATARVIGALLLAPLVFYATAGISGLIARLLGRSISWRHARVSLFWAVLAVSPAAMLSALAGNFLVGGTLVSTFPWILMALFLLFWTCGLVESVIAGSERAAPGG